MNEMSDASGIELSLFNDAREKKIPINGSLELLPFCNLNCKMCYVRLSPEEAQKLGNIRSLDEWISLAEEMKKSGTLFLLLTGGEPLLYKDFQELYIALRYLGMVLTVNTNGTLIDEQWAEFFAKNKPRRLNITLYGTNSETYEKLCHSADGYERVLSGIRLLRGRGVDVKINYSAAADNESDMDQAFEIARQLDVPINADAYMYPVTRERNSRYDFGARISPESAADLYIKNIKHSIGIPRFSEYIEKVLRQIEKRKTVRQFEPNKGTSCLAGNCSFTINWQGMMRPCVMLSQPSVPVFETGFVSGWTMLQQKMNSLSIPEKCTMCHLRPLCRMCPASGMYEVNSIDGNFDYLCRMAGEIYKKIMEEKNDNKIL